MRLDDSDVRNREEPNESLTNSGEDDEFQISDSQDHLFLDINSQPQPQ